MSIIQEKSAHRSSAPIWWLCDLRETELIAQQRALEAQHFWTREDIERSQRNYWTEINALNAQHRRVARQNWRVSELKLRAIN